MLDVFKLNDVWQIGKLVSCNANFQISKDYSRKFMVSQKNYVRQLQSLYLTAQSNMALLKFF